MSCRCKILQNKLPCCFYTKISTSNQNTECQLLKIFLAVGMTNVYCKDVAFKLETCYPHEQVLFFKCIGK